MLWSELDRFGGLMDPWREFERMTRALPRPAYLSAGEFPPVNVWIKGDEALVTTEIAGIDPGSIDISVVEKTLTIRGSRKSEEFGEAEPYHRRERWQGEFSRTVSLPFRVESGKVEARYSRGVLSVELPRAETERPRKIQIKSE